MDTSRELPRGTVAFLLTDVEGSTALWERDRAAMQAAVERHVSILRSAIESYEGVLFKVVGDGTQSAFATAAAAVRAACDAQQGLVAERWANPPGQLRVRMALHAGEAEPRQGDYLAAPLNRLSRLLAAGHGHQILVSQVVEQLSQGGLPSGIRLQDLGHHRLRDLLAPEYVFQLRHPNLPSSFPPLKTLDVHPNNLPRQSTLFVGRERQVAQVTEFISSPYIRLLTLTGPGGIGKTRLALQVAAEVVEYFPGGVFQVDLAPLADASLLPSAIAKSLQVQEFPGQNLEDTLTERIGNNEVLLVLDNFDHLLDSAGHLSKVLDSCARLKILVTSRSPLGLRVEQEFRVPPLDLPRVVHPGESSGPVETDMADSIRLFAERARAIRPEFVVSNANIESIAAICRRLDGLPLAIELAANRIRVMPPGQLLERLDQRLPLLSGGSRDAPSRHRTMRATIDWTHDYLSEPTKALFARLAIFVGGASIEAIEAVCSDEQGLLPQNAVLYELESLAAQSLLSVDDVTEPRARIRMLETIREYALERLGARNELDGIAQRHAGFYAQQAVQNQGRLAGSEQADALDQFESDHDNLRAALDRLLNTEPENGLRLAASTWWLWWVHGHLSEGRRWLERALSLNSEDAAVPWRIKALSGAGTVAETQGDYSAAVTWHRQALKLSRDAGDLNAVARSLESLGDIELTMGNPTQANAYFDEALEVSRKANDESGIAHAFLHLGDVAFYEADSSRASSLFSQALILLRKLGDTRGVAAALTHLGTLATLVGSFDAARSQLEEAAGIWRELGDRQGSATVLSNLGLLHRDMDESARASELLTQALELFEELGDKRGAGVASVSLGEFYLKQGSLQLAVPLIKDGLALLEEVGDTVAVAGTLEVVADLFYQRSQGELAARLLGVARVARHEVGAPLFPADQARIDELVATIRSGLGQPAFDAAWASGSRMALSEAIRAVFDVLSSANTN